MTRPFVAPSLLACDWSRFPAEVRSLARDGADLLHLDVMDGHFVPNLTFGPPLVAAVRKLTRLPLDTHVMIERPERWAEAYVEAGSDLLTFHVEAARNAGALLRRIRRMGARAGVSLKPKTPLSRVTPLLGDADLVLVMTVEPGFAGQKFLPGPLAKVRALRRLRKERGLSFLISVDGGVGPRTAPRVVRAGADVLVAGSAYFGAEDRPKRLRELRGGLSRGPSSLTIRRGRP